MSEETAGILNGPYRATKLWNHIIQVFRSEMPVGKHRRQMRIYDNCFLACEAIDWLNAYLCKDPNFGPNVTRNQTIQLLRKLHQCHVFEEVRAGSCSSFSELKNDRNLYRFIRSPSKSNGSPVKKALRVRKNLTQGTDDLSNKMTELFVDVDTVKKPDVSESKHQVTVPETETIWKDAMLNRLAKILNLKNLNDVLDMGVVTSKHIIHNVSRIAPSGIVMPLNLADGFPNWITGAMKCLAHWPKASGSGSCLPNYQGFERDVFRVVQEFFQNLEEPLSTFRMYDVLVSIFAVLTPKWKLLAVESLQIALLLLPPDARRKLHILIRFMDKVANNSLLHLKRGSTNRALVLSAFSRSVLLPPQEADYDELLSLKLVTFLMENQEEIFTVPTDLKTQVEKQLAVFDKDKITFKDTEECSPTVAYCVQVSRDEYESQKLKGSQQAVADLLEAIVNDPRLSTHKKAKKLKQFKRMYPEIYAQKVPKEMQKASSSSNFANPFLRLQFMRM